MDKPAIGALMRRASHRQLQIFEATARHGSYTRAAEELCLTQPTLSMQIRKLSDTIGLPLFEQVGRKVYLTDAGKLLYEAARQMFETFSRVEMQLSDMKGLKCGHLKLAVVTTAKYFAPRALGQFCGRHPGVDVSLKVTNRERLLERMADNADDLYIMGRPPETDGLIFLPFVPNPLVVIAPRRHPLTALPRATLAQLAEAPFILRETGSGTRLAIEQLFRERGLRLKVRMELGSNEAIKQAVAGELGLSVISYHALRTQTSLGDIAILDVESFPLAWNWYVGYAAGKQLSVVADSFLQYLMSDGKRLFDLPDGDLTRAALYDVREAEGSGRAPAGNE